MATSYSRTVAFTANGNLTTCVELPMPPRGELDRVILTQTSGASVSASFNIYDRKGACTVATDLNVTASGGLDSIANSTGYCLVETLTGNGLKIGDTIEIKGSNVSAYNVKHTVTNVISNSQVVTDIAYTSSANSSGYWQTSPFLPTVSPISHLVMTDTKHHNSDFVAFSLNRPYENRDNQSPLTRVRHSGLWLEITPAGSGTKTWEISYTARANSIL